MNNFIIEITNLYKEIDNIAILNNINLNVSKEKIYGIIGRNGSGKTMFFKAICGLINPTKGEIKVFNDLISNGYFPKKTGAIIENPGFLQQYSAFRNLKILASINNVVSDDEIKQAISKVGLDPNDNKPIKKFSLGMKQRLGIAQAIMEKPELLILDEPMNGLDSDGVESIRDLILELKKQGVTIILASHNSEDISVLCDYVYLMDKGILKEDKKSI